MTERVEMFFGRLDRLSVDDLIVLALPGVDRERRAALLDRVETAGAAAGRTDELDECAERAVSWIVQAFSFRSLEPTWFGLNWGRSLGRSDDRARLFEAIEDAALAAVVADLVPDEAATLAEPFEDVASMSGAGAGPVPSAGWASPNAVRVAWVLGAYGWIALGGQLIVAIAARIFGHASA